MFKKIDNEVNQELNGLELMIRLSLKEYIPVSMQKNAIKIVKSIIDDYRDFKKIDSPCVIDGMGTSLSVKEQVNIIASFQFYNSLSEDHPFLKYCPKDEARKALVYCNNTEFLYQDSLLE